MGWFDENASTAVAEPSWFTKNAPQKKGDWFSQNAPASSQEATGSALNGVQPQDSGFEAGLQKYGVDTQAPEESYNPSQAPDWLKKSANAVVTTSKGFVPRSAEAVGGLLTPVVGAGRDIENTYGMVKDWVNGATMDEAQIKNFPEAQYLREADRTPPGSQERYNAAAQILAQLGMAGGLAKGLRAPEVAPPKPELPETKPAEIQQPPAEPPQAPSVAPPAPEDTQPVVKPVEAAGAPVEDVGISGVANRVYEAQDRDIPSGEGMSAEDVVNLGRQKISQGVDPNEVAQRFGQDKRLSAEDFGVLRAKGEDLDQAAVSAEREVVQDPDNPIKRQAADQAAQQADHWHRNIIQPAKTATSDIFRGMQGETDLDTGSFYGMRRSFEDLNKRAPKPQEQLRIAENVAEVQKATGEREAAINALGDEITKRAPRASAKIQSVDQLRDFVARKLKEVAPCG